MNRVVIAGYFSLWGMGLWLVTSGNVPFGVLIWAVGGLIAFDINGREA